MESSSRGLKPSLSGRREKNASSRVHVFANSGKFEMHLQRRPDRSPRFLLVFRANSMISALSPVPGEEPPGEITAQVPVEPVTKIAIKGAGRSAALERRFARGFSRRTQSRCSPARAIRAGAFSIGIAPAAQPGMCTLSSIPPIDRFGAKSKTARSSGGSTAKASARFPASKTCSL